MSPFRDVEHAREFAARTLAAIDATEQGWGWDEDERLHFIADRARVASDLAGIEQHSETDACPYCSEGDDCDDRARYAVGLVRTGALYGQEP